MKRRDVPRLEWFQQTPPDLGPDLVRAFGPGAYLRQVLEVLAEDQISVAKAVECIELFVTQRVETPLPPVVGDVALPEPDDAA